MVEVKVNNVHNTMVVTFRGVVDVQQIEELHNNIQQIIPKLESGFKILTDLSLLESMDIEAHSLVEKMMQLCNQHGVSKIIRVIPDSSKDIGFNIMSLFNYSHDVGIVTSQSTEEALRHVFLKGSI
ncbi:MAG: hypothetical protein P9M02_00050 [Candidatus Susulua stagnicola]|nr:hypothetical protein [Candidatus Susulua stagnicola]